jgi:hypothetical protein
VSKISVTRWRGSLGFRFGLRDIFAGRLRLAQGQRWSLVNTACDGQIDAAMNDDDVWMERQDPDYIRLKKPAASCLSAGFSILAMMILCQ